MTPLRALLALKPGLRTTEFWSHAIVSVISLLVATGAVPVGLPQTDQTWVQLGAFVAAAVCTGLYALSRARAKAGPSSLIGLLEQTIVSLLDRGDAEGLSLLSKVIPELGDSAASAGQLGKVLASLEGHIVNLEGGTHSAAAATTLTSPDLPASAVPPPPSV